MAATTGELNLEVLQNAVLANLKTNLSSFLQQKVVGFGITIFSRKEISDYILDLDISLQASVTDSDLKGLGYFLKLRGFTMSSLNTSITEGVIDISTFQNLETLKSSHPTRNPFKGAYGNLTKLKTFYLPITGAALANASTPVIFSNNPDLETVYITTSNAFSWGIANVGNLSGLTKIKSYEIVGASAVSSALIDNILSTLRAAKMAGAPLTKVNMTSSKAPTGGASNADAQWLSQNGVTVTLGTA